MRDGDAVNAGRLKALGARGLVRPSATTVQVVLGPIADQVAGEIRDALRLAPAAPATASPAAETPAVPADAGAAGFDIDGLLAALGGRANLLEVAGSGTRLRLALADPGRVDEAALKAVGARGVAHIGGGRLHVILGPAAEAVAQRLDALFETE